MPPKPWSSPFKPLPFCVSSSLSYLPLLPLLRPVQLCAVFYSVNLAQTRGKKKKYRTDSKSCFDLSLQSSCHIPLHSVCVCVGVWAFIFAQMIALYVLYVRRLRHNKLPKSPTGLEALPFLLFASLCSHFVWNLCSLIILAGFPSIAHSLPRSPRPSLPFSSVWPL